MKKLSSQLGAAHLVGSQYTRRGRRYGSDYEMLYNLFELPLKDLSYFSLKQFGKKPEEKLRLERRQLLKLHI